MHFKDQSVLDICIILIRFDYDLIWHRCFCCHMHTCAGLFCSSHLNPFFPLTDSPVQGRPEKQPPG